MSIAQTELLEKRLKNIEKYLKNIEKLLSDNLKDEREQIKNNEGNWKKDLHRIYEWGSKRK